MHGDAIDAIVNQFCLSKLSELVWNCTETYYKNNTYHQTFGILVLSVKCMCSCTIFIHLYSCFDFYPLVYILASQFSIGFSIFVHLYF